MQAQQENNTPPVLVKEQYIKALSFERSPVFKGDISQSPNVSLNVQVNIDRSSDDALYEVTLTMKAKASIDNSQVYQVDLVYAGVFALNLSDPAMANAVLAIDCPRLLFPFARNVLSECVRDGGFQPLLLSPIDFRSLYESQVAKQQADQ